ncbi:MAG TPA: carbohydrate-binding family V/XII [Woeseiaceae bacterium]|nr:carbohydrate-binding family V/XII [Woeseiaceae bacterium]
MKPVAEIQSALWRLQFLIIACGWALPAAAVDWPQEVDAEEGTIVVYQPQPESLQGNVLKGRAAMSLQLKNGKEPIFGAFWFAAKIDTDREDGSALIRDVKVTDVRWPDSKDAGEQRFTALVEGAMPDAGFPISMERLTASLATAEMEQRSLDNLKNDPPKIVFREQLSVLVLYDGKPRFSAVEGSDYERVLNTPVVVVRRKKTDKYYLSSGQFWYQATDAMGPWMTTNSPPADLVKMLPKPDKDQEGGTGAPPAIVTATEPTELISSDGKPDWETLPGGELMYVENTESPWLRELSTGNIYLLLSGRWYRSKSSDGPWTFVRSDELPKSFAAIPPASDIGGLRSSVAGTEEAKEAVLDAQVPQTAAIKRDDAKLSVDYDGKPQFEKIPGTSVSYAVNTGAQVLQVGGKYYAVDNGVWFTSGAASGPWVVADDIPKEEIDKIPPSSPVYNTTFVSVYESTPEIVYVGYTPGYMWSYPYYGVPVYGTGWAYPPYYGHYYYPRPPTWGFNVGYNPWTGWNFGLSWSNGFFSFGMGWGGGYPGSYRPWGCCNGWYGGGHRGPVIINTGNINIGNNVNIGNRTSIDNRINRNSKLNINSATTNIYNRGDNRMRNADKTAALKGLTEARPTSNKANNVFADKNGNIARNVNDHWESRENGQWKPDNVSAETRDRAQSAVQHKTTPEQRQQTQQSMPQHQQTSTRPATRPSMPDYSGLDRANQARQRGTTMQQSRPHTMRHAPARRR